MTIVRNVLIGIGVILAAFAFALLVLKVIAQVSMWVSSIGKKKEEEPITVLDVKAPIMTKEEWEEYVAEQHRQHMGFSK